MKQERKLNRKHKEFLKNMDLDSKNFLVEINTTEEIRFINKKTNKVECFKKDKGEL